MKITITHFRGIAFAEGISFLALLGIAMPLKYFANTPEAVKVVGWAHGVLFLVYVAALLQVGLARRWSLGKMTLLFVSSLLPAGPFVADAHIIRSEIFAADKHRSDAYCAR